MNWEVTTAKSMELLRLLKSHNILSLTLILTILILIIQTQSILVRAILTTTIITIQNLAILLTMWYRNKNDLYVWVLIS